MNADCWPWSHRWTKWTDKSWSKLMRSRNGGLATTTSTVIDEEVGLECTQERRCTECNKLQLRSVSTRI